MNSKDITVTKPRAKQAVNKHLNKVITPQVEKKVKEAVEKERIRTGVITKFYPYWDKAEVKLDGNKKKILCKILHRYGGDMIDFYTPSAIKETYDEKRKEVCVIPKSAQHVLVLNIHDADSTENLILGYYQNKDIVGFNPAKNGHMKLMSITEPNLYWLEFGPTGLDLRLSDKITTNTGTLKKNMKKGTILDSNNVYTKEEIDAKMESDCCNGKMFKELLEVTENYKQFSNDQYTLFRGDCWTINNNFESSAAITSNTLNDVTITGTFRTKSDMVGLYWNSKDLIQHPYISYGERSDYRGVVLDFDYTMTGCKDFSNNIISITIAANTGETYYLTMNRFISNGHVHIDFDKLTLLPGNEYLDKNGNTVHVDTETPIDVSNLKFIMFVIIPTNYVASQMYEIMANVDYTCQITNIAVTRGDICKERLPF